MDWPHVESPREDDAPIYLQLYRRYRDAITDGKLRPGDRVPSVRSLASELNLARGTVEAAYQMLSSEGYFVTRGAAGTRVAPALANPARTVARHAAIRVVRESLQAPTVASNVRPFQLGVPALDAFPRKTWARIAGRNLRTLDAAAMTSPDPAGYVPLRRAIAAYLQISRGVACAYEQVFVTAGYRGALELVRRALLHAGDLGWYEDPGYALGRHYLELADLRFAPAPVDDEGIDVAAALQRAPQARFAVVTPGRQSPTGVALSPTRRLELLEWATRRRAWIVEDDYDSEFHYHGRPLPALQNLDRDGRVLYTGTFSKVLLPGLRLAYLVVPEALVGRFAHVAGRLPGPGSILPQATVAAFMEQGHFARHLRKMRALYAERRAFLVDALARTLGEHLHIRPQAGGVHVLAYLSDRHDDKRVAAAAAADGLGVQALSDWRMRASAQGGLLMGFANFATAEDARAAVRRLSAHFAEGKG
ncbi:PLP-dependent aminotransferase family protein [Burkholderia multivorans]|uniref:DNA-binding protein n=1 Tax=Burkholderia multivorans TaxID=87883 RepID=A0A2S9MGX1_9BURK|nr:PLP-dependent aminotransferase family protein [Burkholderia multivorans]MBR7894726.1 PLP-dependent aminotransferase family protein [Burkholderia multivorans]MBU9512766.1 PLP-dependent aminotransferase family protein [Burkholderia multivorans]MBU9526166.1 PLP-dependent aminotransferase family protein [Burkholderia multivorans]MBU9539912.1 PLP-dependent aminotransferase family protein [Burkholderia multivorans]MBU9635618.1 PLP-dependent aminotransferase family protein [Burkholderia multivoran